MKRKTTKIICMIMALAVIFTAAASAASAAGKSIRLVVLGDSVGWGSYVTDKTKCYGSVLAAKLTDDGYDVEYINYSVPKYSGHSHYCDLYEETYLYDHNRFMEEVGARNFREGVSYSEYIGNVSSADIIVLQVGGNELAAAYYALRGYEDYYKLYGDEHNIPMIQNDIDNGKVDWIYTLSPRKIERIKKEFADNLRTYLDKNTERLHQVNPNAQIIVCDLFNPYQSTASGMDYVMDLAKGLPAQAFGLLQSKSRDDLTERVTKLKTDAQTVFSVGKAVIIALMGGEDINRCDKFDLSKLRTTQKLLYKVQYARVLIESVKLYDVSDATFDAFFADTPSVTRARLAHTELCGHMTGDGSHPSEEGHSLIAEYIYDVIDFSKLG